ncbi:MAG TPA: nitric-oxide reductase large subunit [Verrucomicrobiae bacterium]|jgi:nitric oxide reductase subunit B|nr:nitric-oxide reductase large subunit [Verrucomicrobiae bacterium]
MKYGKLWAGFILVTGLSFTVLGYFGREIYRQAPPIPQKVVTASGEVLFTAEAIRDGQNVWQSTGGQELGSVWGHGAYVAPDWTADWTHREATALADLLSQQAYQKPFDSLGGEQKKIIEYRLQQEIRANTFHPETGEVTVSDSRAQAIKKTAAHYSALFLGDPSLADLRETYAMKTRTLEDPARMEKLNAFFFWAAWACVTQRPGQSVTYTNNWPADELVGNHPTGSLILWTGVSVILLLAGIGVLAFFYASQHDAPSVRSFPDKDPLLGYQPTPSMKATLKFFWTGAALFVVQVVLGVISAHYSVEGSGFYGIPLSQWLPYSVARTWHVQLGIFWIATSWLATGLYVAPAVSGHEPAFQRAGVNFLYVCLLIIVVGSLAGQWLGVMQKLGLAQNFWFGHQGYEYVDLGRFWQIFLTVGLFLWLFLMTRALMPAFRKEGDHKQLLALFVIASAAIALFYSAGLMWGQHTHLSIAEYWRWWVVHLWVEGFFEVFATVVIAFLFVRLGLLGVKLATAGVLFSTNVFLAGGIIGTFHHLYFTGTPTSILALGATFSALEVVPLVLMGFEAWNNYRLTRAGGWLEGYKWPIYCFIAVSFWNLLGAGIFGFLINPPIALYYMQGLNTTPVHGHTALFGVYGMLAIGLMLFVIKGLHAPRPWKQGIIRFSFWAINIGLLFMVVLSLLPIGLIQTWFSVEKGFWYARSGDFLQTGWMDKLRWMRVLGDTLFGLGALALGLFVAGLKTGASLEPHE